jgi:FtsH-binding integral membrane protein
MSRHAGRRPASLAAEYGSQLSRRISAALLVVLAALWVSGILWLLLHYLYAKPGEFGVSRHPLEAPVVTTHGVLALIALFLLGWFTGRHASAVSSGRRLVSGWILTVLMGALILSGCAQMFLTSADWQAAIAIVHEVLGAASLLPVLAHGWRVSAAARAPDRAHGHDHGSAHDHRRPARPPRSARN